MGYRHLTSVRDGAVERVMLNRPDVRNALDDEVIAELTHWAARVREHRDLRVAVLSGAGSAFSAGAHEFLQTVPNERIDKPFEASVVRSIVSRFVTAPHGHSGRASVARVERSDR